MPHEDTIILVDSSFWISLFNTSDANHEKSKRIYQNLPNNLSVVITNLILYEVLTVLSMRVGHDRAIKFGKLYFGWQLAGEAEILYIDEALEHKTWSIFRRVKNKNLSFADCAALAVIKEWDIKKILTFDKDFKVFEKEYGFSISE